MTNQTASRAAVVTGIGMVAPNGIGIEEWWSACLQGRSGIKRISRFNPSPYPIQVAGEVEGFDPERYVDRRMQIQTDRATQMTLAAAEMALADAGLDPTSRDPERMSVAFAGSPGHEWGQRELEILWSKGPALVDAYTTVAWLPMSAAAQLTIRYGMKAAPAVFGDGATAGLEALRWAAGTIWKGADVVLAGGASAPLTPFALAALGSSGRLSCVREPDQVAGPFDRYAAGWVPGEGAVVLVVEDTTAAIERGADLYGEIVGYGETTDGHLSTQRDDNNRWLCRAMALALERAETGVDDIDLIVADGWGVQEADMAEILALQTVFGGRAGDIPITAPTSMTGRLAGAPVGMATALLAMRSGQIPPIAHLNEPQPGTGLQFVTGSPVSRAIRTALVTARSSDGVNAVMVVRRNL